MTTFVVRLPVDRALEYLTMIEGKAVPRDPESPLEAAAYRELVNSEDRGDGASDLAHVIDVASDQDAVLIKLFWGDYVREPWSQKRYDEEAAQRAAMHNEYMRKNFPPPGVIERATLRSFEVIYQIAKKLDRLLARKK